MNVYPPEIENVLDALPGIGESAVFGLHDADLGERVCAAVVARDPALPPEPGAIIAAARAALAGYKIPRAIWIVDALPRNAMGKVQKNVLRERFGGGG
jgi:malonyl-CoA/methylmalonyl-CoA synthetase